MWEPMACSNSPMGGMLYPRGSIYGFGDGVVFCVYSSSVFQNTPRRPFTYTGALSWLIWGTCGEVDLVLFSHEKPFPKVSFTHAREMA